MIAFDLQCSKGHTFEGWFDSLESFEEQQKNKLVQCPYCDDENVRKILSPVAVKTSQSSQPAQPAGINYQKLAREVVEYIKKNSEDVGTDFTAEALKIHYGVAEKRNIRGSATEAEEKTLEDEGVQFIKIPMPVSSPDKKN